MKNPQQQPRKKKTLALERIHASLSFVQITLSTVIGMYSIWSGHLFGMLADICTSQIKLIIDYICSLEAIGIGEKLQENYPVAWILFLL